MSEPVEGNLSLQSPKPRTFRPFLGPQTQAQSAQEQVTPGMEIWDLLDQEAERGSVTSSEFGRNILSFFKPRKLRKNASSSNLFKPFFLNLSTASIGQKLRKRKSRIANLRDESVGVDAGTSELPGGVQQIGGGIGFQYSISPEVARSRTSVSTTTPRSCHGGMFGNRFSLSLKSSSRRLAAMGNHSTTPSLVAFPYEEAVSSPVNAFQFSGTKESNQSPGSFAPDTSRPAIWSGSPVHLAQPTRLANDVASLRSPVHSPSMSSTPGTDGGPFTPTTVACDDDDQGNALEELGGKPDITLRLVPARGLQLSAY